MCISTPLTSKTRQRTQIIVAGKVKTRVPVVGAAPEARKTANPLEVPLFTSATNVQVKPLATTESGGDTAPAVCLYIIQARTVQPAVGVMEAVV